VSEQGALQILRILDRVGVIVTDDHFVYTSGKHGSVYIDKDALYPHTTETSRLCRAIAEGFVYGGVEAVVAPEKGGIILSQWVAFHLSEITGKETLAFYAEKSRSGGFILERGGAKMKLRGKKILVVEDVLTTGGSAKSVIEVVRAIGGNVVGLGVLVNRGGVIPRDVGGVPKLISLVNIKLDTWDEADCPLCKEMVPINIDVGKGREFLARREK